MLRPCLRQSHASAVAAGVVRSIESADDGALMVVAPAALDACCVVASSLLSGSYVIPLGGWQCNDNPVLSLRRRALKKQILALNEQVYLEWARRMTAGSDVERVTSSRSVDSPLAASNHCR